jgi:hypothetical protein
MNDRSPVQPELDRVGASFAKAGPRDYISVQLGIDEVKLLGPPREQPRRSWVGRDGRRSSFSASYPTTPVRKPSGASSTEPALDLCGQQIESPGRVPLVPPSEAAPPDESDSATEERGPPTILT